MYIRVETWLEVSVSNITTIHCPPAELLLGIANMWGSADYGIQDCLGGFSPVFFFFHAQAQVSHIYHLPRAAEPDAQAACWRSHFHHIYRSRDGAANMRSVVLRTLIVITDVYAAAVTQRSAKGKDYLAIRLFSACFAVRRYQERL